MDNEDEKLWESPEPLSSDEEFIKYRPKIIRQYEENGVTVTVYEARYV